MLDNIKSKIKEKHQWRSEGLVGRIAPSWRQSGGGGKNGGNNGKNGAGKGASGTSPLFEAAKLQSVPGADNPRYAAQKMSENDTPFRPS